MQPSTADLQPVDSNDPNTPGHTPTEFLDPDSSSPKSTDS